MKKLGILLLIIVFTLALMASCKSTGGSQTCPAYGQKTQAEETIQS